MQKHARLIYQLGQREHINDAAAAFTDTLTEAFLSVLFCLTFICLKYT